MKIAITYYRVSTEQQGISGLGLAAQEKCVKDFAERNQLSLVQEFVEVDSGKKNVRPILAEALAACRKQNAILLIAKLDRLGRNVSFISSLLESDVEFVAVDNPFATKLIVHILAAFAEYERDQISIRTKQALAAAKLRGVRLGRHGADILSNTNRDTANAYARTMQPVIQALTLEGYVTVRELMAVMNRRKIATFNGKRSRWHIASVHALLKRIENLEQLPNIKTSNNGKDHP
jgi:DNA invertase Pin-like site-specific DNA recombinase